MIVLLTATAIGLSALQSGIAGPTDAFRGCLREAATKAKADNVTADGIEAYLKKACTAQMGTLDEALIAFRMKNGMTRKAAASDAAMTVDDYVSTPSDNYKFTISQASKPAPAASVPAAAVPASVGTKAPVVTPASAPATSQPPKS